MTTLRDPGITVTGRLVRTAALADEWCRDVDRPSDVVEALKAGRRDVDIFSFWQRLPHVEPRYDYYRETDSIAALPITGFEAWWRQQVDPTVRNKVRGAARKGVEVRRVDFDDDLVAGMTKIFNECPVRQGRRFHHYGKDVNAVAREFSRYLFREEVFGAYLRDELIGFLMLADAGTYADITQILGSLHHRDKAPTNALLARAVETCAAKATPYLVYARWVDGSLGEFKRHNGFRRIDLPRYYVPLTTRGRLALAMRLHRGLKPLLPLRVLEASRAVRRRCYRFAARGSG
jgi:hypothetical protein